MDVPGLSVAGVIKDPHNTLPCVFCKSPEVDEVNLGPIYTCEGVVSHYYCLLFSAALSQTGSDDQGILGFMPPEIRKEVKRASRLKCSVCRKTGASIGCCKTNCQKTFHFPCGLKDGINFQFTKDYQVFCKKHSPLPDVSPDAMLMFNDWTCPICLISLTKSEDPIMTSCCKPSVYHRNCLKQMALNAGYFFKCPLCNAGQEFVAAMREQGIFVPAQDASWEREPNAFQELYEQYQRCDAAVCECPKGREYAACKGGFLLARCRLCGAKGTHRQCGKLKTIAKWACEDCIVSEQNAEFKKKLHVKRKRKPKPKPVAKKKTPIGRKVFSHRNSDDDVDMSKVQISPACFAYFPYSKPKMKRFQRQRKQVIPDWRGLKVQCNLVNWIGNAFEKSAKGTNGEPLTLKIKSAPLQKNSRAVIIKPQQLTSTASSSQPQQSINISKNLDVEPSTLQSSDSSKNLAVDTSELQKKSMSTSESLPTKSRKPLKRVVSNLKNVHSKVSKPRRRFKLSKWQRGVVKRRRQINPSKTLVHPETSLSDSVSNVSDEATTSTSRVKAEDLAVSICIKKEKSASPPSSFFKVPNPLKKSPIASKSILSGSDLKVDYIVETISAVDDKSSLMDVDLTALQPLQYYSDEFLLMDLALLKECSSSTELNVFLTDITIEGIMEDTDQTELEASSNRVPSEKEKVFDIINALLSTECNENTENKKQDEQDELIQSGSHSTHSEMSDHSYAIRLDECPVLVKLKNQVHPFVPAIKTDPDDVEMKTNHQELSGNEIHLRVKTEKLDTEEENCGNSDNGTPFTSTSLTSSNAVSSVPKSGQANQEISIKNIKEEKPDY